MTYPIINKFSGIGKMQIPSSCVKINCGISKNDFEEAILNILRVKFHKWKENKYKEYTLKVY